MLTVPAPLQAGAVTSNMTPPLGTRIVGGFAPDPAEHIHDELHARCLVLDDGQTRLALVVCDLLGHNRYANQQELDDYQRFVARRIANGVRRALNLSRPIAHRSPRESAMLLVGLFKNRSDCWSVDQS